MPRLKHAAEPTCSHLAHAICRRCRGPACAYCGQQTRRINRPSGAQQYYDLTDDHVIPQKAGGKRENNIAKVCAWCNASKGSDSLAAWLHRLAEAKVPTNAWLERRHRGVLARSAKIMSQWPDHFRYDQPV